MSTNYSAIDREVLALENAITKLEPIVEQYSKELDSLKQKRARYEGRSSSLAKAKLKEYNKLVEEMEKKLAKCKADLSSKKQRLDEAKKELTNLSEFSTFVESQIETLVSGFKKFVKENENVLVNEVKTKAFVYWDNRLFSIRAWFFYKAPEQKVLADGDFWPDALNEECTVTERVETDGVDCWGEPWRRTVREEKYSPKLQEATNHLVEEVRRRIIEAFEGDENFRCYPDKSDKGFYIELR